MAQVIFAISVVGVVALMGRSIESQRASRELREAERLAQALMADLSARGFLELAEGIERVEQAEPQPLLVDLGRPPADLPVDEHVVGSVRGAFVAFRRVEPLGLVDGQAQIGAVRLWVIVLWLDTSNPVMPPPAGLRVSDLVPRMADPSDPEFRPYVGHVQLSAVRVNDAWLASTAEVSP